nr:uncharacterized protein LOC109173927 [Ipomoea batatas]
MVDWLGSRVIVVKAEATHNMVELPLPHLVTIHYHSIYAELQFTLDPFVSALLNAFQVTPYQFTPNAHRLITCFMTRCLEVEVSWSLALFLRLFRIGHTNSILHFAPVHHHTIFVDLTSLKKWKEKFIYVSYTDDIILLGFTNTWSLHITYTTEPYPGLDAHADLLCAGGLFDHHSYSHLVYLHQLSQRAVAWLPHGQPGYNLHAHSVSSALENAFLVTLERAQARVKSSVAVAFEQDTRGTVMGGTIDPSGMDGTTLHSNSEFTGSVNSSAAP